MMHLLRRLRGWFRARPVWPWPKQRRPVFESLEPRIVPDGSPLSRQLWDDYGRIRLAFEANQGQTDAQVRFLARGSGYGLFLTPSEAVLNLRPSATAPGDTLRIRLVDANARPQ